MLADTDLSLSVGKDAFKREEAVLELRLSALQRQLFERKIPAVVVFEGWDAAGKGRLIGRLIGCLDPRGFRVYTARAPTEEERLRPFLWRFWARTPRRGQIAVFDRSWYRQVLSDRAEPTAADGGRAAAFRDIAAFERQLHDDGCVVVKMFLHISRAEQKRRLTAMEKDPATRWRVTKADWRRHKRYKAGLRAADDMLARTDAPCAPWTVVEAEDWRYATLKMLRTAIAAFERALRSTRQPALEKAPAATRRRAVARPLERRVALTQEQYRRRLDLVQDELREWHHHIYARRIPVAVVFEGWDAAGKGGTIRRLTSNLDPRGYDVVPVAAPTEIERQHHYLWRFWTQMPKGGHFTIFDRSWYGRVLVERVEGFCTEREWARAYREINEMERHMVSSGAMLFKFWLNIDKAEQLRRFRDRQQDPARRWKITAEDWRNRRKWGRYARAVDEMLLRTSPSSAPWIVVDSTDKQSARIQVLETVVKAIRKRMRGV